MNKIKRLIHLRANNIPINEYRYYILLRIVTISGWLCHFSWIFVICTFYETQIPQFHPKIVILLVFTGIINIYEVLNL